MKYASAQQSGQFAAGYISSRGGDAIPEGVGVFRRDFPAPQNHQRRPSFAEGTFEEQSSSQSEVSMNY